MCRRSRPRRHHLNLWGLGAMRGALRKLGRHVGLSSSVRRDPFARRASSGLHQRHVHLVRRTKSMLDLPRHRAREEPSPRRQMRPPVIDGDRIGRQDERELGHFARRREGLAPAEKLVEDHPHRPRIRSAQIDALRVRICSGLMYPGVPSIIPVRVFARAPASSRPWPSRSPKSSRPGDRRGSSPSRRCRA